MNFSASEKAEMNMMNSGSAFNPFLKLVARTATTLVCPGTVLSAGARGPVLGQARRVGRDEMVEMALLLSAASW